MLSTCATSRAHAAGFRRRASLATLATSMLATLALAGCAGPQSGAMQSIVDSWRAVPVKQATAQWGPPASVQRLSDGTAYLWIDEFPRAQAPGSGPREARAPTDPAPATVGRCQRRLIARADGIVERGDWQGDACCLTTAFGRCAALLNRQPRR